MSVWGAWREALHAAVLAHRAALGRLASLTGRPLPARVGAVLVGVGGGAPMAESGIGAAVETVAAAARDLPAGWAGSTWAELATRSAPENAVRSPPTAVRVGVVHSGAGTTVPFHVSLFGCGHVTIDASIRDARVAALFQTVVLRVLACSPPGGVRVLAHDPAGLGRVFAPFAPLVDVGAVEPVGPGHEEVLAALDRVDAHVRARWQHPDGGSPRLLVALAGLPPSASADIDARIAALAHAGPAAGVSLLLADWPPRRPPGLPPPPDLDAATQLRRRGGAWSPTVPGLGDWLDLPVELDPAPPEALLSSACRSLATTVADAARPSFEELLIDPPWTQRSAGGLATPVGRADAGPVVLRFDDATPHWLIGGRSGAGKTVFLLDVLAGLAVRYPPSELALYLLDFKEGVSFTEFTPTGHDPSWVPQAVAVGVESDREYGLAVLRALRTEMSRRAGAFKAAGVTTLAALRAADPTARLPRVVAVIDEFQVLFAGNDDDARQAGELLEDLARKGRSFGIHLVLASQTAAGIEALQTKLEAIFGQFPLRIALAGGSSVLDPLNSAADGLSVGTAVVNHAGGGAGADTVIRVPYADPEAMAALRRELWGRRDPGAAPPAVFAGFAEQHLDDDPTYAALVPGALRRLLLLGRRIDIGSPTAALPLDAVPGRHLAVVGPSGVGADVLHGALAGLARQHAPGTARFLVAPLLQAGDDAAHAATDDLAAAGHEAQLVPLPEFAACLAELARFECSSPEHPTYLVIFGAEAAGPVLSVVSPETFRPAADDLRTVVQSGPVRGVHVLGWWRSLSRLANDLGPTAREDVACLLALNVPGSELQNFLGRYDLHYQPRSNRALLLDRHEGTARLVVPFVRGGCRGSA